MCRSILVPLDGSAFGEQALPLARSLACRAGAALHVAFVHVPYTLMYLDSVGPLSDAADRKAQEQERAYLVDVVRRLPPTPAVGTAYLEGPVIAERLEEYAASHQMDLIVMTTHGRGPLSRAWLGSVADELVRRATQPVLLVRPHEGLPDLTAEPAPKRFLIPLDGTEQAEQILNPALALGGLTGAEYTLVRVVGPLIGSDLDPLSYTMVGGYEPPVEQQQAEAEAYLRRVAERLPAQGHTVRTRVVVRQHPATGILEQAQAEGSELIALATHGRRGLTRLLLGSVADKVVRGASTPVLVCRTAENPREKG
jgi:nucleotide-binding universal stress UspA family protein